MHKNADVRTNANIAPDYWPREIIDLSIIFLLSYFHTGYNSSSTVLNYFDPLSCSTKTLFVRSYTHFIYNKLLNINPPDNCVIIPSCEKNFFSRMAYFSSCSLTRLLKNTHRRKTKLQTTKIQDSGGSDATKWKTYPVSTVLRAGIECKMSK